MAAAKDMASLSPKLKSTTEENPSSSSSIQPLSNPPPSSSSSSFSSLPPSPPPVHLKEPTNGENPTPEKMGQQQTQSEALLPPKDKPAPPYTAFPIARKNLILILVTAAGFFGPLSGGIYLPALPVLADEFNVSLNAINATVSVFMAVFAIGPLFWAAMSDANGRRPLYILSFSIFICANVALAAIPANYGGLLVLRIVQAVGSCSVASLGAGTVADVTEPKARAFAMSIFLLGPQTGPILGPVLGGAFASVNWRWIFGFLSIGSFVMLLLIIFLLPETLRARVGNGAMHPKSYLIFPPKLRSPPAPLAQRGPRGPKPSPKLYWNLFTFPPIGIVSLNTAFLFASFYCISVTQPIVLGEIYGWSTAAIGASYVVSGAAMVIGSLAGGKFSDVQRAKHVAAAALAAATADKESGGSPKILDDTKAVGPERRLADQAWGVLLCGAGTLMYGWFAQQRVDASWVLVSTFFAGFGMTWVFVTSTSFLTESAPQQAAAVFALGNLVRNPAAAIAAVVINPLSRAMGYGWCFTGLAVIDLFIVGGALYVLLKKSGKWRVEREEKAAREAADRKIREQQEQAFALLRDEGSEGSDKEMRV